MMSNLQHALDDLRYSIKNINCYKSAYVNPEVGAKIQDKFGTVEIISSSESTLAVERQAYRNLSFLINQRAREAYIDCLPSRSNYINLRNDSYNNTVRITSNFGGFLIEGSKYYIGFIKAPYTLILPYVFYGSLFFVVDSLSFRRGIYLNSVGQNILSTEMWINNTDHIDRLQSGGAKVDFDSGYNMSPMYLNRLYLSTQTFANLANKLGTVTGGKLYLGTKNTDRMTTAQKDAIKAKGWTIY